MDDLLAFLRARLAEDEAVARAAMWDDGPSAVWTDRPPKDRYERHTVTDYCDDGVVVVTPENADAVGVGPHIARHDPARILAEVEAKRQAVDRYAWLHEHGDTGGMAWVLRALAAPFADHRDYRPEWAPDA
ncbi:hypothetical protein RVR_8357 [Actinacidiphila reveromycinica]|uniref:Uncharacterized protein n=1 Tax=Actinacidiphila reveromycinica TaxID=659352 RepID=A0A7U3UYT8_9ACTN|nr:DUF6221 family protein [Streptomyces sp. SN-593]BBB01102.1 hypothetical protein RVR_8357 [Streptomyces sp. SN-593]